MIESNLLEGNNQIIFSLFLQDVFSSVRSGKVFFRVICARLNLFTGEEIAHYPLIFKQLYDFLSYKHL